MRGGSRPPRQQAGHLASLRSSSLKLMAIAAFSIGLLAGYSWLGSPHSVDKTYRRSLVAGTQAVEAHVAKQAAAVHSRGHGHGLSIQNLAHRAGTPSHIVHAATPAPQAELSLDDPQHPHNKQKMIEQASHHDEHKSDMLDALKQGQSAEGEARDGASQAAPLQQQQQAAATPAASGTAATPAATASPTAGSPSTNGTPAVSKHEDAAAAAGTPAAAGASAVDASRPAAGNATSLAAAGAGVVVAGVSSSVAATAAALQKGAEKLKEATKVLEQKKQELEKQQEEHAAAQQPAGAQPAGTAGQGAGAQQPAAQQAAAPTTTTSTATTGAAGAQQQPAQQQQAAAAGTQAAAGAAGAASQSPGPAAAQGSGRPAVAKPTGDTLMEKAFAAKHLGPGDTIHTLFTSNGSPYQNFQARIMVATWQLMRKMPGGDKFVAMTRILHRTTLDGLENEIPTFRAQPLQPECDKWCWFPVADRANAMQQWMDAADKDPSLVKAPWLLLLETDYVWMKPLPPPGDAYDPAVPGWSFAFDYIAPQHPIVQEMLRTYCPTCDPKSVPNSGPAPVLARFSDFKAATPLWEDLSLWIETHEHAKSALGWVREMYAWDIGVAANRLNILNKGQPHTPLISQPPHDSSINNASMFHYTWGAIMKDGEKEIWKFDKRFYTDPAIALKVPKIPLPPAFSTLPQGTRLQDGADVTPALVQVMTEMITRMNEAADILPDLTQKQAAAAA